LDVVSLFAGAGGLDLGFKQAGFNIPWANEYDKSIWESFELNFPDTKLDRRSIAKVASDDIPDCVGIVGGPPCQSWSEAGSARGIEDSRGQLFYEYIRVLRDKRPMFFLAENVSGMLFPKHAEAFANILEMFEQSGYNVTYKLLNAKNYGVPQDRKRVIFVGYHQSLGISFRFPEPTKSNMVLQDAIGELPEPEPAALKNHANPSGVLALPNHEYMTGGFSTIYMSRNRVRMWDEPSFTIQAGGRHAPIHPNAPVMPKIGTDKRIFVEGKEHLYRRLSVRECARVQTFPDEHVFLYDKIADGYKMVGNAVPVRFANLIAKKIFADLQVSQLVMPTLDDKSQKTPTLASA
jgi:DNA (cytosine-5)-methyltransferase 1